jgi:hypothetical protein
VAACSKATSLPDRGADADADVVKLTVCAGRTDCAIESDVSVGSAVDGRALRVVVARFGRRRPARDHGIRGPLTEEPWERFSALRQLPSPPPECTPWETWLVARSGDGATRQQLLAAQCASDDANRAPVVERLGPSELRSTLTARANNEEAGAGAGYSEATEVLDFGTEPPRILRIAHRDGYGLPGQAPTPHRESSWDWEAFRGHACWHGHDDCAELLPVAHIADDGAYAAGDWKTTGLGQCALLIDGTPSHGVAEPAAGATSSVRALLADDVLYLEVTDDAFVTNGEVLDAVEVLWSFYEAKPGEHAKVERLTMDGKLTRVGATQRVEVAEAGPNTRRFALTGIWPPEAGSWSLSYLDTDDGRTVRTRISSVPRQSDTGQTVLRVEPRPTCAPRDQVLRVGQATATDHERAIVP